MRTVLQTLAILGLYLLLSHSSLAQVASDYVVYETALNEGLVLQRESRISGTVVYQHDNGSGNVAIGPPSTFDPDMLWGNYFLTQEGGEVITQISVAFGSTFPSLANGPVTFWLLDDPDMDLDPRNATALVSVEGVPDVFGNVFFTVDVPPTQVSGAFFVGASAQLLGGQDRPARVDTSHPGDRSWFFYAPDIAAVIDDLASAPFGTRMDNSEFVPFPGAFMVRAVGEPAPADGLTFSPPISQGLSITVGSGETGEGTVTLSNPTDAPISFSFSQYDRSAPAGFRYPANPLSHVAATDYSVAQKGVDPLRPTHIPVRGEGGPDAFGYSWIDSDAVGGPAFQPIDIRASGVERDLVPAPGCSFDAEDEGFALADLPFPFSFYGQQHQQVWISANGFVAFQEIEGCTFTPALIPSTSAPNTTAPGAMISPLWADFDGGATGAVHTEHLEDGRFVIQWTDWPLFMQSGANTFQVILSPSGTVRIQYLEVGGSFGSSVTVGQQDHAGEDGLLVASGEGYAQAGKAIVISAAPVFVTDVSPASGTLDPGGSVAVTVSVDAAGFFGGSYGGSLTIETDEDSGTYAYPVEMVVTGEAGCTVEPVALAFGTVIVGTHSSLEITIANDGTAGCLVGSVTASDDQFGSDFEGGVSVAPGTSITIDVVFTPTVAGQTNGSLSVPVDGSDVTVMLSGTGIAAPEVSVAPVEVSIALAPDEIGTASITVSNLASAGASDLVYSAFVVSTDSVMVDFEDGQIPPAFTLGHPGHFVEQSGGNPGRYLRNNSLATFAPRLYIGPAEDSPFVGNYVEKNVQSIRADAITHWVPYTVAGRPFSLLLTRYNGQPQNPEAWHYVYRPGSLVPQPGEGWSEYSFDIPSQYTGVMPEGWGGGYYGDPENLPAGVTWQDVISEVDEAALVWGHPAFFYILQDFDLGIDNVGVVLDGVGSAALVVTPPDGSVAPGDSQDLTLEINTAGFEPGTYEFSLRVETNDPASPVIVVDVAVHVQAVGTDGGALPLAFALAQNYPNPFASSTTIGFVVPEAAPVLVEVFDLTGRRVATLVDRELEAGHHEAVWNADGVASGVYLYRIQAGEHSRTLRAVVLR